MLCAEHDPSRAHGHVTWRVHGGLPVVELVNNWACGSFEDTYRPPLIGDRIAHVLRAVQPDIVHIHSLLNLSFDLPAMARARGIPIVATLHDYALVCPSGGQRIHRAEQHVCVEIDTDRCVRCFQGSAWADQISFGRLTAIVRAPGAVRSAAVAAARRFPGLAGRLARAARRAPLLQLTKRDVDARLAAARRLFDDVDLFVAPSSSIAAEFLRLGVGAGKLRVSDYGFVPLTPRPRSRQHGPLRVGYVGTLVWHKGVHALIDAVRGLQPADCELKIFGDPDVDREYSAGLRVRAADLPIAFMGAFDREGVADAYSQIDVLVVPSLWLENSPLVIHEAFMAGVPVVGARIGGIVDLVQDGVNGLLYDPAAPDALGATLQRLIDRPTMLADMTSHLPAVKSIEQDAREWEATYQSLLDRRRAAGAAS